MALAAAMALIVILDAVFHWLSRKPSLASTAVLGTGAVALVGLHSSYIPALEGFPLAKYRVGEVPALYEFFQKA